MHSYEIEIKSLLGSKENADRLRTKLTANIPPLKLAHTSSQLNHYFNAPTDLTSLGKIIQPFLSPDQKNSFNKIVSGGLNQQGLVGRTGSDEPVLGKKVSVRTRRTDTKTLFIIKASVGDDTSANGVSRIEFEVEIPKSIEELDQMLVDAGLSYQAKWSRNREEYKSDDLTVTIDKNAGYGYLAEFEKVTNDESKIPSIKSDLLKLMEELGVAELPQDRLERMFAHYNTHWQEYYGTDKVFVIE